MMNSALSNRAAAVAALSFLSNLFYLSFSSYYLYNQPQSSLPPPSLFWRLRRGPCIGARSLPRWTEGIHVFVLLPELCVYELTKHN